MTLWIDAQLSPAIAAWISATFSVNAVALRDINCATQTTATSSFAARGVFAVVMTKDSDFLSLLAEHGVPPQVIWLTCGNTSNARLKEVLAETLPKALDMLEAGEPLVEITG